jgi:nicotinate dehydrogenase subunit A
VASNLKITVNGRAWPVAANPDTPLLYELSKELHLRGPRFGCGLTPERLRDALAMKNA